MTTIILLGIILAVQVGFMVMLYIRGKGVSKGVEPAISKVWRESGLDEKVGQLASHVRDIRETHTSIELMLRVPKERASIGEISLETILEDQLPRYMFGMRMRVLDGKYPDAHIRSTVGLICIDSKFPLDNYRNMIEAKEPGPKETFRKQYIRDVRVHLEKIAADYVCPEYGSAEFAFAYIPSEGVYYFLTTEAYELLRDFTKRGVQVISPLTLAHKVELIKTGTQALRLSNDAEQVRKDIAKLSSQFMAIDQIWKVFYDTHVRNLSNKSDELDQGYKKLREEFQRISTLSERNDLDA